MTLPHQPARRWSLAPVPPQARVLESAGYPAWLSALMARRGVTDTESADAFLAPRSDHLRAPHDLLGVSAAVERISVASQGRERVAIVGDYDVDGVSATALLSAVFRAIGLSVEIILPNRLQEGYGFQPLHVARAHAAGCTLIVTADCGTTAQEAVGEAQAKGIDVIVTDHHLAIGETVQGAIEVNPKRQPGDHPFSNLAGAGVALHLAIAVADHFERTIDVGALLRIACLGTICDLVPLLGENRTIAAVGLQELVNTRSPGLRELMRRAAVRAPLTSSDVGYRIGPRLNAAGRMSKPDDALELLMTRDRSRAAELAQRLDDWNRARQAAEARVVEEALEALAGRSSLPSIVVGWSDGWHPGVVGIAAGRIARQSHRPTVLFSVDDEWATGSGRSIADIHLHEFLSSWSGRYERFGGHAQAIGIKVRKENLEKLSAAWEERAAELWSEELLTQTLVYELEIPVAELDNGMVEKIRSLEPFGMGNPEPRFRVGPLRASGEPRFFGKGHLGLQAEGEEGAPIDLLGWGWEERVELLQGWFEVLGCLERDTYTRRPVLRLVDARPWRPGETSAEQDAVATRRMADDG